MKKWIPTFLVVIFAVATVAVGIYNWCTSNQFFQASITQILTLIITLGIAFWATQYKNDFRKTKEHAEVVIEKLQMLVSNESFYSIPADGDEAEITKLINVTNRKINNCIDILEEYGKTLGFSKSIEYIRHEFNTYKTTVGNHIKDLEYLSKTEDEFKRIAENIDSKCDYIILSLYK